MNTVQVWIDHIPRFEQAPNGGLRLVVDDSTTVHISGDMLRELAAGLLVNADLTEVSHRAALQCLVDATEMVAESRRKNGEISPDGTCWACKVDDHSGHRDYNEGRCYGCSCAHETAPSA